MPFCFRHLLLTSFLAAILTGCIDDDTPAEWSLPTGSLLPDFCVTTSEGNEVYSSSIKGKQAVITFFNTDCADCRHELPEIQKASDTCSSLEMDVEFLCIAREEDEASISRYWSSTGLTLPYSPQPDRRIYNLFANTGIPRIYIVSPDLRVTAAFTSVTAASIINALNTTDRFTE